MKFLVSIFLIALTGFALGLYLPWWTVAIASFLVSFFLYQKPLTSLLTGFLGIFLLWAAITIVRSSANEHILAHRMSMFILKNDSPYMLIFLTAFIGGIIGGLGALSGSLLRRIRMTPKVNMGN